MRKVGFLQKYKPDNVLPDNTYQKSRTAITEWGRVTVYRRDFNSKYMQKVLFKVL